MQSKRISFSSRYYKSFRLLQSQFDDDKLFRLIYNEDKETYSYPYLYENYRNELNGILKAREITTYIEKYLKDNLFNEEENKLLLEELKPFILVLGSSTISKLENKIAKYESFKTNIELVNEYKKTIEEIAKLRIVLIRDLDYNNFMITEKKNDKIPTVFVSYTHDSEEHKDWVLQLATRLRHNGVNVILDQWNLGLGENLSSFMEKGLSESHRVICVCSSNYVEKVNNGRGGAGFEKNIIASEYIKDQNTNWVIPVIKNNCNGDKTPIFLRGRIYVDFEEPQLYENSYEILLRNIHNVPIVSVPIIGRNPFEVVKDLANQKFIPNNEKYVSPGKKGKVVFDFSNNNGVYVIGIDEHMFEIKFSKSSDTSIYLYDEPNSIRLVAIAKGIENLDGVQDCYLYDASSHARNIKLNQIAVLQNMNGFWAGIKILGIKDCDRNDDIDEVIFEYFIQTNGSNSFI